MNRRASDQRPPDYWAAERGYPVAVDNKGTMWRRYHNSYWPSIYLVDKSVIASGAFRQHGQWPD
jgi:hypothetical protein